MTQAHTSSTSDSSAASPQPAANQAVVQAAISEISHIATLPEVTMKIIQLVENPESTAQDLNRIISNDPALGARILKVVNSAFYGLPGQIGSINRAIVLLGLNAVKNIAIAASLAKLFRGGRISPNFNARDLWTNAIASATATRLLADRVGLGLPDEAFLAGLIHDLGILVEIQARRPKFIEVLDKLEADPNLTLRDAEMQVIGATHEHFGAALCKLWKFPTSFAHVTGYHHHPWDLPANHRTLAGLVHVSDVLSARLQIGFTRGVESTEYHGDLLTQLRINDAMLQDISELMPEAMEEAKSLFADVVA